MLIKANSQGRKMKSLSNKKSQVKKESQTQNSEQKIVKKINLESKNSSINQSALNQNSRQQTKREQKQKDLQFIQQTIRKRQSKSQKSKKQFPQNQGNFITQNDYLRSVATPKETLSKHESPEPGIKVSTRYQELQKSFKLIEKEQIDNTQNEKTNFEDSNNFIINDQVNLEEQKSSQIKEIEEIRCSYLDFQQKFEKQVHSIQNIFQTFKQSQNHQRNQQLNELLANITEPQLFSLESDSAKCTNCQSITKKTISIYNQIQNWESYVVMNKKQIQQLIEQNQVLQSIVDNHEFYQLNEVNFLYSHRSIASAQFFEQLIL